MRVRTLLAGAGAVVVLTAAVSLTGVGRAVAQIAEAALVRDADNPARQPFQAGDSGRIFGVGYFSSVLATVPDGKRLVLEYVSAWIADYGYSGWFLEVKTVQNGVAVRHMAPLTQETQLNLATNYIAGQPVRLYADPGTPVTVAFSRIGSVAPAADVSVAISGHLVDVR